MKYSKSNPPMYCPQNQSTWLKGAVKNSTPVGILWHETAGGNPNLSRYIQPDDAASDKQYWLNIIGKNKYGNDWNHIERDAGLNCWIGKLADGSVATVQTGPWTTTPWGCGSGSKGSCNGYIIKNGSRTYNGQHWIQFEICDDGYKSKEYFEAAFEEACQLTAYLCHEFNIDPNSSVIYNGVNVPTILCHADSYKLKLGGNHGDIYSWFNIYGKDMTHIRARVSEILKDVTTLGTSTTTSTSITAVVGDEVRLRSGVTTFTNGKTMASWLAGATLYVREIRSDSTIVISTLKEGDITGVVYATDLVKPDGTPIIKTITGNSSVLYRVRKSWTDAESQLGAYANLANAKDCCNKAGNSYHVFDENGNVIYSAPIVEEIKTPIQTKKGYYSTGSADDIKHIWDFFKSKISNNDYAVAALMGNIFAESSFVSNNLQQTYEKSLGYSDSSYTFSVDDGSYANFVKDSAGYGLVQWTYYTRKQSLLDFALSQNRSIGDLDMQLDFTWKELSEDFKNSVLTPILSAKSIREASDVVLIKFEAPAKKDEEATQALRASYAQKYYDMFHIEDVQEESPSEPDQPQTDHIVPEVPNTSTDNNITPEIADDESQHVGNLLLNLIYSIVKIIKRMFGKTE